MFNLRRVFPLWAIVASFLSLGGRAQAQTTPTGGATVTLAPTGVQRDHQDKVVTTPITQINYKDCLTDDQIKFTLNLGSAFNQYGLEVWAGDGCDTKANRMPATATCWQLQTGQPTTFTYVVTLGVQQILKGRTGGQSIGGGTTDGTSGTGGTGGTDATGGTGDVGVSGGTDNSGGGTGGTAGSSNTPSGSPPECTLTSGVVAPQNVSVYFLMMDGAQNSYGFATWKATYKLSASAGPDHVTADSGENMLPISWSYDDTNGDPYINGYQFYCDPAPGQQAIIDAGIVPDPNVIPICQDSTVLIPGTLPEERYKCGTAGRTSTRGSATGLVNNVAYHVAVSATDTYLNVGNISSSACNVPQPVTGFFEAYRLAGGEGGGGFCSFSRHTRPGILFTALGLGLCLILRRRRAT